MQKELDAEKAISLNFLNKNVSYYLENTVIANLFERMKAVEDTVERLWAI